MRDRPEHNRCKTTAQPLRIRYQPDGSRYQGAVRDLVQKLGSGNVDALSELQGVAGGVPVFTGLGTMKVVSKSEFGPDDDHGNLEELAALANIENLSELAALAKANDQFIVMGADGKIAILPIKSLTDEIAKKFQLPEGGTPQQLLTGDGGLTPADDLPVSTAMQTALDAKATNVLVGTKSSYNWIINGDFTINQRAGVKKPANGVYGFDRWKGHAGGIEQIIEALPAGEYTLTWSGSGNGTFGGQTKASPIKVTVAGGNTSVVVPQAATKVSVVVGDATTKDPWVNVNRSIGAELLLCLRYYRHYNNVLFGPQSSISNSLDRNTKLAFDIPLRVPPTASFVAHGDTANVSIENISITSAVLTGSVNGPATWGGVQWLKLDAEL